MTPTERAVRKFVKRFPKGKQDVLREAITGLLQGKTDSLWTEALVKGGALQAKKGKNKGRLAEMLDDIDKFLSNHDGTYKEDARALWHIIGGATRGPDDEASGSKSVTVNLRGIAFPRTAAMGTGTGAAFTTAPQAPNPGSIKGLGHFVQHAQKAVAGLIRAGRIEKGQVTKAVTDAFQDLDSEEEEA